MATLYLMCGLPASGKSTIAIELATIYNAIIISSDKIREELYGDENIQGNGKEVFNLVNKRTREALEKGVNVIYDATNIKAKGRKQLIKMFNVPTECYYMKTPLEVCRKRNAERERHVPEEVIERMYKNFEEPRIEEGFTRIYTIYASPQIEEDYTQIYTISTSLLNA